MKKILFTILTFLISTLLSIATDANRVRKYLADHGESNAVFNVNFGLRNDLDDKGWYIDPWSYTNIAKPTLAECPSDEEAEAWSYEKWQTDKPYMLKMIENVYVDFLTNDWTMVLRSYEIIASNYTVDVTNTDTAGNITYLLTLKAYNKPDYYNMAGEFDRYKNTILEMGGIMSEVRLHEDILPKKFKESIKKPKTIKQKILKLFHK